MTVKLLDPSTIKIDVTPIKVITPVNQGPRGVKGDQGIQGIQGLRGLPSQPFTESRFSWGDAFPKDILSILTNEFIYKVEVIITEPFDTVSSLSIGDDLDNERLFSFENINMSSIGTYQSNPGFLYNTDTQIKAYLTLGSGNSAGSGSILIYK